MEATEKTENNSQVIYKTPDKETLDILYEEFLKRHQLNGLLTHIEWALKKGNFDRAKNLIDQYRIDPTIFRK